jgi:hypothetical protein
MISMPLSVFSAHCRLPAILQALQHLERLLYCQLNHVISTSQTIDCVLPVSARRLDCIVPAAEPCCRDQSSKYSLCLVEPLWPYRNTSKRVEGFIQFYS